MVSCKKACGRNVYWDWLLCSGCGGCSACCPGPACKSKPAKEKAKIIPCELCGKPAKGGTLRCEECGK